MNPLKLYGVLAMALVVLLALAAAVWKVNAWRVAAEDRDRAIAERDQAIEDRDFYITAWREAQEASRDYQTELADLRVATTRERLPVVRLCREPAKAEHRPLPAAGPGLDDAGAAARDVPPADALPPGRDLGPELFALADRADELSAQVRGLQAYAVACSGR